MIRDFCLCRNRSVFEKKIIYRSEKTFGNYEGFVIGRCTNCGLLKTIPPKNSGTFNPFITKVEDYEKRKKVFEILFRPIVDMVCRHMKKGSVLDVGCSSGILLSLLNEKGFDAYGVEPNKSAYAFAKKRHGSNVFNGTFEQFRKQNKKKFDCIIYNHVLEHVEDVGREIKLLKQSLKKKGYLVVGIPNTRNAIFWIRSKYWESLLPLEHVWHFSDRYMKTLLSKNSFMVLESVCDDDPRKEYPLVKRIYFFLFRLINKALHTGEAVLMIAKRENR